MASIKNVRSRCGHHTCSVHHWLRNSILPQFDPQMSSLALLEAKILSPLYITGKNNVDVFLVLMVAVDAFPLCMDMVQVMVVRMVQFVNKR